MTEPRPLQTIAQIQSQLDETLLKIAELERRRKEILDEIRTIDKRMYALAFRKAPAPESTRKKIQNELTLRELIPRILKRHRNGLTLDELAEKVEQTGHRTHCKSMRMVVYQAVYRMPNVDCDPATRRYQLKKEARG